MSPKDEIATPPMFMAFDLLQLGGDDLKPQPLRVRLGRSLKWLKVKQANYRVEERGWHKP